MTHPPTTPARKTRILVVDDHPLIRGGLVDIVERQPDMEVCGEAGSGREALEVVGTSNPDVAVVDLRLGDRDGLDVVDDICRRYPHVNVLVLSRHEESVYAERALKAGAIGYVMKHACMETVLQAVRSVRDGDVYLSEAMKARVMRKMVGGTKAAGTSPVESLSAREFQIFSLIGHGRGPSRIAKHLHISVKTVDAHQANIRQKLGFRSMEELRERAVAWCHETDAT